MYTEDTARYERADGALRAVGAPTAQNFWTVTATGTDTARLDWAAADDTPYAMVLANADGTPGVTATVPLAGPVRNVAVSRRSLSADWRLSAESMLLIRCGSAS